MSTSNDRHSAERACFSYLMEHIGGEENVNAFLGNFLTNEKTWEWCFQLEGLTESVSNYGFINGAITWTVHGTFTGSFRDREEANLVIDRILKASPKRDIEPNITAFYVDDCAPQRLVLQDEETDTNTMVTHVTARYFVVYKKTNKGE